MLIPANTLARETLEQMLQAVYEGMDSGEAGARIFFADFSKGFYLIDHTSDTILIQELDKLNFQPALQTRADPEMWSTPWDQTRSATIYNHHQQSPL